MLKKVLLLSTCFRPNIGGVETHLDDLIEVGVENGVQYSVITYQPLITKVKGKYVEQGKGYKIFRIPWIRFNLFLILEKYPALEFMYLTPGIFLFSFFYLFIGDRSIKTIHAQGISAGAVGLVLAKLFGKKIIISTHSIYHFPSRPEAFQAGGPLKSETPRVGDLLYSSFVRWIFRKSDKILTLSKQSKKEVKKLGVPREKVSVFTYWVDQNKFRTYNKQYKKKIRKKLGWDDKFVCLFVGRLVEVKGVQELMDAARLVDEGIYIAIAGDGPLAEKISNAKSQMPNLIFLGRVENEKLPLYYNAVDVLIIPSTHEEGFGRVILEALSCGLPVIGSERGAIPEAMDESVGYFVEITPENIASKLNDIYKNKKELKEKAKKASEFAKKKYSKKNIETIIKFYE